MRKILEIACFNLDSAILAQACGADRIELCENYPEGGTSPNKKLIFEVRQNIQIPVHVIIRPRGGNFVYSKIELQEMRENIQFCKNNKIDGIVFGVLTTDKKIDEMICEELIALAKPMSVTFHRAIDGCADLKTSVQKLIDLGFKRVLTSGGENCAMNGLTVLKEFQNQFGSKITIMPAGAIRSTNLSEISAITLCTEFHSAAITTKGEIPDENELKTLKKILSTFTFS